MKDLKEAYKTIEADHFAPKMEISFIDGDKRETLSYENSFLYFAKALSLIRSHLFMFAFISITLGGGS